jgi:hypothetical protein
MLLIAAHTALGRQIGGRDVGKGSVLYLAGENPVDVQMRWIAMAQQYDFDLDEIDVHFVPGVFKISEMMEHLRSEVAAIGGVNVVLIDTSSAYFEGDNENDKKQAGDWARLLRSLTELPGGPCVIVAWHHRHAAAGYCHQHFWVGGLSQRNGREPDGAKQRRLR